MPRTPKHYPPSMLRLSPAVRAKAMAIAAALLEEGHEEGEAMRIAIARAERWAEGRVMRLFEPKTSGKSATD
ncbi:MAG TPA: hypothetical protein VIW78_00415 [Burkholderiales bacterium]